MTSITFRRLRIHDRAIKPAGGFQHIKIEMRGRPRTEPRKATPAPLIPPEEPEVIAAGNGLLPIAAEVHRVVSSSRRFPKEWYEVG